MFVLARRRPIPPIATPGYSLGMLGDIEAVAGMLLRAAGLPLDAPSSPLVLAERLLGDGAVRTAPASAMASRGALVRVGGRWRIYLNAACGPKRKRFVVLHEVAHWALPDATEEQCDRLAGALLVPRAAFIDAARRGPSLATCRRFGVDCSCAWLRYGETVGADDGEALALVAPSIRLRGAAHPWPVEFELRALASASRTPGLRRRRLSDDRGRTVLRAS